MQNLLPPALLAITSADASPRFFPIQIVFTLDAQGLDEAKWGFKRSSPRDS